MIFQNPYQYFQFFFTNLLHHKVLKFYSNQSFCWEYTCHTFLKVTTIFFLRKFLQNWEKHLKNKNFVSHSTKKFCLLSPTDCVSVHSLLFTTRRLQKYIEKQLASIEWQEERTISRFESQVRNERFRVGVCIPNANSRGSAVIKKKPHTRVLINDWLWSISLLSLP